MGNRTVAVLVILGAVVLADSVVSAAEERYAANATVAWWRQALEVIGEGDMAGGSAIQWAHGAAVGLSVFAGCTENATVAELVAYMRYTADPGESLKRALGRWAAQKGCTIEADAGSLAHAHQEGRDELSQELATLRTVTDPDALRVFVVAAQASDASPEDIAYGLIAGARLLELQGGGGRGPRPLDTTR